jgi:hypothetical protein
MKLVGRRVVDAKYRAACSMVVSIVPAKLDCHSSRARCLLSPTRQLPPRDSIGVFAPLTHTEKNLRFFVGCRHPIVGAEIRLR